VDAKRSKDHSAPFPLSNTFTLSPDPAMTGTATVLPTPAKSQNDKKEYRALKLSNGLTVLLISDESYPLDKLDAEEALLASQQKEEEDEGGEEEEDGDDSEGEESGEDDEEEEGDDDMQGDGPKKNTEPTGLKQSAAALCINIGSFSDPDEVPGMAHFLEHMVFMGTTKYPDENSFDAFNRKYGGFDNASTDCETTLFYFEIPRRNLVEGMDRFAQFFIDPLMKIGSMQREREAVDSEFQMALPSDYNRMAQIYGGLAAGHPMSKFMWGNKKSLSPGLSDEEMHKRLHEFRLRHYSAQYMTLAVQSQHPLDTMQEWVEQIYSAIPNNKQDKETFNHLQKPFSNPRYHKLYRIHPVQNVYQLDLNWSLPPLQHKYRTKPLHYMSWVIGHEGKGSLLSYLRKKVWALSLTSGCEGDGFEMNTTCSLFVITVVLTKTGYEQIENVLKSIFGYLSMMQAEGPNSRIFGEIQEIERLDFAYKEDKQPCDNVETISENMQFYSPERFLDGDDLLFEYDQEIISECTQALVFDSVNMFLKSRDIPAEELDQVEPWFNTKFSETSIPASWAQACKDTSLSSEFHLPLPNLFIAEDLSIRNGDVEGSKYPVKIVEDSLGELFYKKDDHFLQPRSYVYYHLRSPLTLNSIDEAILMDLLSNCLLQLMVEDVYPADMAQLGYALSSAETGITIKVCGLSDKLPRLLDVILEHMVTMENNVTEDLFRAVSEQTRKNYYNHSIKPSKLVRDVRLSVIQDVYWTAFEKHNRIRNLSLDQLKQFIKDFRGHAFIQGLVQGNITSKQAMEIDNKVRSSLGFKPLHPEAQTQLRCKEVAHGSHLVQVDGFNSGDANTLVTNYYQAGPGGIREHTILEIVCTLMEEPVFDTLRTQEQLGYSVFNTLRNTFGVLGFSVTVNTQATKFSSEHVDQRIELFLAKFVSEHLNAEKVEEVVRTLNKQKVRADVTLAEEVNRHWGEIMGMEYNFNRNQKEIQALATISVEDVLGYFRPLLVDTKTCRKLSVHVIGSKETTEEEENDDRIFNLSLIKGKDNCVADIEQFKEKLKTHPVLYVID